MKILNELPLANESGSVKISIDDIEDFWVLANLIRAGDTIFAPIRRKVVKVSTTGKTDAKQVFIKASIRVVELDFQPYVDEMNIRGTLTHDIEGAKIGEYQRVLLEKGRPFVLSKGFWDSFSLSELTKATDPTVDATLSAVIMQNGIAHICLIGKAMTVTVAKVEKIIPKIRQFGGSGHHSESKLKFFEMTANALIQKISINDMKCIIVASPGFLQHEFVSYLRDNQSKYSLTNSFSNNVFVEGNVSTGHPYELDNLLNSPEMQQYVSKLQATQQAKCFDKFLRELNNNFRKVVVGKKQVYEAGKLSAIDTLLVTSDYIMNLPLEPRLEFLKFKEELEHSDTNIILFSSKHQSGEQLNQMGGVAGLCKFELPEDLVEFD